MVPRSEVELEVAKDEIACVARRMIELRSKQNVLRNTERCVDPRTGWKCDYFPPHANLKQAEGWQGFIKVEALRYVGEKPEPSPSS